MLFCQSSSIFFASSEFWSTSLIPIFARHSIWGGGTLLQGTVSPRGARGACVDSVCPTLPSPGLPLASSAWRNFMASLRSAHSGRKVKEGEGSWTSVTQRVQMRTSLQMGITLAATHQTQSKNTHTGRIVRRGWARTDTRGLPRGGHGEHHRLACFHNRSSFLMVLETGSRTSRPGQVSFPWGLSPWPKNGRLLPLSSHGLPQCMSVSQSLLLGRTDGMRAHLVLT